MDLIDKLNAALDETERIARATFLSDSDDGDWIVSTNPDNGEVWGVLGTCISLGHFTRGGELDDPAQAVHIAHQSPKRILDQVAAHRKILDRWADLTAEVAYWRGRGDEDAAPVATEWAYRQVAQLLAEAYGIKEV